VHEYSLMQSVMEAILKELPGKNLTGAEEIREVMLKVGALELHSEESFKQAFSVLAQGTPLEKAELKLTVVPAELVCAGCGRRAPLQEGDVDHHDPSPVVPCPACGRTAVVSGGRGVDSIQLVVEKKGAA
jgi:hydrogenase nickel insertion protein HypA